MKIEWLPASLEDRDSIYSYISADSMRAAIHINDAIETQIDRLLEYPNMGRVGRQIHTRELVLVGTPYVAVYMVRPDSVLIVRVLHAAQAWPSQDE